MGSGGASHRPTAVEVHVRISVGGALMAMAMCEYGDALPAAAGAVGQGGRIIRGDYKEVKPMRGIPAGC